jgi:hypothetical protein
MKTGLMIYTTESIQVEDIDKKLAAYLKTNLDNLRQHDGKKYLYDQFDLRTYLKNKGRLVVCRRNDEPVGFMIYRLCEGLFPPFPKVLMQDLLSCQPKSRAAYHLMKEFIDFGRANTDHIITMIGHNTNIKRRSLERLGFVKADELYRIEV